MQVIRDLSDTAQILNPEIRALVQERINELGGEAYDSQRLGYFVVVEAGDSLDALTAQIGFDPLRNRSSHIRFGEPGFMPSFEFVEEFPSAYETVFIIDDSGYGIDLFIPRADGIGTDLLSMCKAYATTGNCF
jgi:hypothetical protein